MTVPVTLAPGLVRLRAPNPSPLTGTGTNTYLVGTAAPALIDPGPDLEAHLAAIRAALGPRPLAAIVVTHRHRDHSALAPRLAALTGAPVVAFCPTGRAPAPAGKDEWPEDGLDSRFRPDRCLGEGEVIAGEDWQLRVLHTPGHLDDHICLAAGDLLFTGDHVMGWASSVVSPPEGDMGAYVASLRRLGRDPWRRAFPGHGEPVEAPGQRIADLLAHRLSREAQILAALDAGPATPSDLRARIYRDTPAPLWPAAERNVLAHLLDLAARGLVCAPVHPDADQTFRRP
jgi:hydroxyacylglutathione hydrolase